MAHLAEQFIIMLVFFDFHFGFFQPVDFGVNLAQRVGAVGAVIFAVGLVCAILVNVSSSISTSIS